MAGIKLEFEKLNRKYDNDAPRILSYLAEGSLQLPKEITSEMYHAISSFIQEFGNSPDFSRHKERIYGMWRALDNFDNQLNVRLEVFI